MVQWQLLDRNKLLRAVEYNKQVGGKLQGHLPLPASVRHQIIITHEGLQSRRYFTTHCLCWSVSICQRGQKGHSHRGEHSPSRMRWKTQRWAAQWRQSWGCSSGHYGPARASCVPRGASAAPSCHSTHSLSPHNPQCHCSPSWQWMTGTTNLGHS